MTDIIRFETAAHSASRLSIAPLARAVASAGIAFRHAGSGILRSLGGLPQAIVRAYHMAYLDPFVSRLDQPVLRDEDGRDPRW